MGHELFIVINSNRKSEVEINYGAQEFTVLVISLILKEKVYHKMNEEKTDVSIMHPSFNLLPSRSIILFYFK